jgi:large subunit ribosomal protein L28e
LLNLHSHKYSGLANAKVINIYGNTEGGISITTVKKDAKPTQVRSNLLSFGILTDVLVQVAGARSHVNLRRSTAARRANKIAAAETAGKGYRADLRPVSGCFL